MILPNLEKYKGLTESERNLFRRGTSVGSSLPTQQASNSSSSTKVVSKEENLNQILVKVIVRFNSLKILSD